MHNNRKILLYVDQNGPVKVQYQPPNGILPIKREMGENQSKWQVWIQSDELNSGVPVSNFNAPCLRHDLKKPKFTANWAPEKAIYTSEYENVDIITEIFVPFDKATVCMKTKVVNKSGKTMDFSAVPVIFPYMNIPQMVAWDLPEWYLASKIIRKDGMLTFHGQMTSPEMDKSLNRSITFNVDYDENATAELDMSAFCENGNFFAPRSIIDGKDLSINMKNADGETYGTRQTVYAAKYKFSLKSGESKTLTQAMTVQEDVAYNEEEIKQSLEVAFELDERVVVEKFLKGKKDINCAAYSLGGEIFVSEPEEAASGEGIYSFADKYLKDGDGGGKNAGKMQNTKGRVEVKGELRERIRMYTKTLYKRMSMYGVVRMDYLLSGDKVYLGEVNTVPGSLAYYLFCDRISEARTFFGALLEDALARAKAGEKRIIRTGILEK